MDDIITYARDAASRSDDLFAVLGVDATCGESDIRRAFRKKALTAHPDKAGDKYDPALYERLERARDVLLDPAAREVYDNGMRAQLQKKVQLEQMSSRRRKLVEELEQREREAAGVNKRQRTEEREMDKEREAMAARGRQKMEELRRLKGEAEERERAHQQQQQQQQQQNKEEEKEEQGLNGGDEYDQKIAELERKLREKQQRKADRKARKEGRGDKREAEGDRERGNRGSVETPESKAQEESLADQTKQPPQPQPPSDTSAPNGDTAAPAPASAPAACKPSFASTMARLKAAQAKRDEEKRRREAEQAAS